MMYGFPYEFGAFHRRGEFSSAPDWLSSTLEHKLLPDLSLNLGIRFFFLKAFIK